MLTEMGKSAHCGCCLSLGWAHNGIKEKVGWAQTFIAFFFMAVDSM